MKTVIIGNSGSGKTWLSRQLVKPGVTLIHLDELFWMPGGFDKKRSQEEVNRLIDERTRLNQWIVEGVFGELALRFLDTAECLVWLDLPLSVCRQRLVERGSESKKRHDRQQSEDGLNALLEWASHYLDRTGMSSYKGHHSIFSGFEREKAHLESTNDVDTFLQSMNH